MAFAEVYAQEDYPRDKVVNCSVFQMPFSYALPIINQRARSGKPFFETILTVSESSGFASFRPIFTPKVSR